MMKTSSSSESSALGNIIKIKSVSDDVISWRIPSFPVESKRFLPVTFTCEEENGEESDPHHGVVNADHPQIAGQPTPIILDVTKSCEISLSAEQEVTVLWEFTIITKADLNSMFEAIDVHGADTYSDLHDTDTDTDTDDESVSEDELDYECESEDEEGTHTVPFKVMGTFNAASRQCILKEAYRNEQADIPVPVPCRVTPEETNDIDPNAICVELKLDNEWQKIGYVQKELCPYVRKEIDTCALVEISLLSVNFRLFEPPGFYAKITLTKTGTWDKFVVKKSLRV